MKLVFVTPNSWNADETQRLLAGLNVEFSRLALPRPEGVTDLESIARFRARAAFEQLQRPCFVENTQLALDGEAPLHSPTASPQGTLLTGAQFKQLHRELGDDGFCQRFGGRRGETRVVVALAKSATDIVTFAGRGEGQVITAPRGSGGYGWDRVWLPDGYAQTNAELGASQFLTNMRQRPFLELAAHVRGDGAPGYFEAHVTVMPCDMTAFAKSCERLSVKCLHIVMPKHTAQAEQPMTGSYHLGTLVKAREEVLALAQALVRDGFTVTRMKIEATGRAFGAPETDAEAKSLPRDVYFEHHATVLLPDGFDESQEAQLQERCAANGGYVSRNLRKSGSERFITIRTYQLGRLTADARFEALLEDLRALNIPLKNRAREFAVYDSAPQIDAGWMAKPPWGDAVGEGTSMTLEEVLKHLHASSLGPKLVLRGSLLTELWIPGRQVNDIDVLVDGEWNPATLSPVVREVFASLPDSTTEVKTIWEETDFPGVRATIWRAGVTRQVDFGWGEILAAPPRPLEVRGLTWRTVCPEVMFGWKTHSLVEHGPRGKWHAKSIADLVLFKRHLKLDWELATKAIHCAFHSQKLALKLLDELFDDPTWGGSRGSRGKWKAYRKKAPWVTFSLEEAVAEMRETLRPLLRP